MMHRALASVVAVVLVLAVMPTSATAQIPDEFKNLKLLDPGTSKADLVSTMRTWSSALGVRCAHCHVGPDNLQGMDFATDEKASKRTARRMLELSRKLNRELLADLPTVDEEGRDGAQVVSCYTCHRGQATPPRQLAQVLGSAYEAGGVDAAADRYREMRADHFGRGRYDFQQGLPQFANSLLESGASADAITMVQLGLEYEPGSADLLATLGHAQLSTGDLEAAEQNLQKALEIDPENRVARWGQSRLNALKARDAEAGGR